MATKKKKTSKIKTLFISLFALVAGVLIGFVLSSFFQTTLLEFEVVGGNVLNVKLNDPYVEKGILCEYDGIDKKEYVSIEYFDINGVKIDKIDTTNVTSYLVKYIYEEEEIKTSITRVVNIVELENLEIHFLTLGNQYTGDSIYIKAGETDILIDAGSRSDSASAISSYIDKYVSDSKLEYVIATHADQDHIAAFPGNDGILELYEIDTIIDFPLTNKTSKVYQNYRNKVNELVQEGTKHYTALECYNNENGASRIIELAMGIEMEILYNYYYENKSSDENNYSVCVMLRRGDEQYLFTGDLEKEGEEYLIQNNELGDVYLYKAGHHGSKTSSSIDLLNIIKPEVVVVTCVAFSTEYTVNMDNVFPTKTAIDNFNSVGVKNLYVTSMVDDNGKTVDANGNIVMYSNLTGTYMRCSNNNNDFYTFEMFKKYRTWN